MPIEPYSPEFGRGWDTDRRNSVLKKNEPDPKITVSIPVTLGGYTGQRDQWEESEGEYKVELQDGVLVLTGKNQGQIKIPWSTLQAAAVMVAGPKPPAYR